MSDPSRLLPAGAKPRGADLNSLRAQVLSQRVTGSAGTLASQFSGGSTLAALGLPPAIRRTPVYPFRVFDASTSAPAAKVTVYYGEVNNFVPTIGGISIFSTTPPALTVISGTVYLDATVDAAGTVTALVISNAASTPADTTTNKYRTLASVTVASNAVTAIGQSVTSSLMLYVCGGTAIWEQA